MATQELRRISKALFGSRYRLEVAAAVAAAEPNVVYVHGLGERLGLADNLVRLEIGHFEEAGLLIRLPRPPGQQHQHYERMPSSYWHLARLLLDELEPSVASEL
jgi:hypothetical protein